MERVSIEVDTVVVSAPGSRLHLISKVKGSIINNAPVMTDITINMNKDTTYALQATDITSNYSDVEGDSALGFRLDTLPHKGQLKYQGSLIGLGEIITMLTVGDITYTPPAGAFGTQYTSFRISVHDDGLRPQLFSNSVNVIFNVSS